MLDEVNFKIDIRHHSDICHSPELRVCQIEPFFNLLSHPLVEVETIDLMLQTKLVLLRIIKLLQRSLYWITTILQVLNRSVKKIPLPLLFYYIQIIGNTASFLLVGLLAHVTINSP